ncbi:MAG: MATE family efflux transporter [Clostridia bacterium]|nr:MATE family efflux transporter [Clostridia bacterium]
MKTKTRPDPADPGGITDPREFRRKLFSLTLPIATQSLMLSLVAACDALMLGQISQTEMTAVSLASQVQFVQNMFLFAATGAGSVLGAQYRGKGDVKTLRDIYQVMLCFCAVISLTFFAACEAVPELLMSAFSHDKDIILIGAGYLSIAGFSYLLTGFSQSALTMMKVTDRVKTSAGISSFAVLLNIALNSVLIFGLFGAPVMRSQGAALATAVSRVAELGACVLLSIPKNAVRPARERVFKTNGRIVKDYVRQYLPLSGSSLLWGVGFTAYTAIIGHMNTDAAAANSVASVVRDLICCVCDGMGSAAAIMVGNELGAGKLEKGKDCGKKLKNISFVIGFISMGIVLGLTPVVVRSVVLSDNARSYLTGMMIIMSVYMIGRCVNTITINGVFAGGGDTTFDFKSLLISMWMISIPLALLGAFVLGFPVLLVYSCTCLDEVGKIPWVVARFYKYRWVRDLTIKN